jgi:hypothetical protein
LRGFAGTPPERYIKAIKFVTVEVQGKVRPGRVADDYIVDLSDIGPDLRSILESGGLDRARSTEVARSR